MLKAIKFALMYKDVVPELIEFISLCANSKSEGLTKKERSALMTKYWQIVKTVQKYKIKAA